MQEIQILEVEEAIPQMRCLIANDDLMQLECLKMVFQQKNFEVVTAINGLEAYTKLYETLDEKVYFDLVVLDLNMPISDGYESCNKILNLFEAGIFVNKNPKIKISNYKPVMVACSSLVNEEINNDALSAGFDLTLEAPLTADKLE